MPHQSWKIRSSEELFRSGIFCLRRDQCELPDGRIMPRYYVLEFPDWVNVVPVTADGQIVLVEQFRHAAGETTIEIPGGSMDPEDLAKNLSGEASGAGLATEPGSRPGFGRRRGPEFERAVERAAARELIEETGYEAERLIYLGAHLPNPAMQSNRMHTFLGVGCRKVAEPSPDPFEDIVVQLKSWPELLESVRSGAVNHSIVMASLLLALPELAITKATSPF